MPSEEAGAKHRQGREAGARGEYVAAVQLFTEAAALAPDWPYPVYDRAFTHLLMENFEAALADYEQTLKLSPRGFFTAHVAVDTLRREANGEFPRGLYAAYLMIERLTDQQRPDVVRQMVEKYPGFPRAWLDYSNLADTPADRLERIERGLATNPDPDTYGMLKLNQAMALRELGRSDEADPIIESLAGPESTLEVEALAKILLNKK